MLQITYHDLNNENFNYQEFSDIWELYEYLLIRLNSNVQQTIQYLKALQKQKKIPPHWDIDKFTAELLKKNLITKSKQSLQLSAKGEKKLTQKAFLEVFKNLKSNIPGQHKSKMGHNNQEDTDIIKRPYQLGDSLQSIDYISSIFNHIKRTNSLEIQLENKDLEVFDSNPQSACASVLMIDVSHSMILYGEDRITPAKQVALAFCELIKKHFKKDSLNIILFGDRAEEISLKQLPYIGVGPYHTNTMDGLRLARKILLKKKHPQKQIFMITDGKPSMMTLPNGSLYKNSFGLDPKITGATLEEAIICHKKNIPITTFMVTSDPILQDFVEQLTKVNRGKYYYSGLSNLGQFIFQDFLSHRKKKF